jgi:hypothetical protein
LTHRISNEAQLVLEESSIGFTVTYLTLELQPDDGDGDGDGDRLVWFSNNGENFSDYNTALEVFRRRRNSEQPFAPVSRYSHFSGEFELV